jgi:triosephosphate isomerase
MRKKIVAGNWKMNTGIEKGNELAKAVRDHFRYKDTLKAEVIVCPPFTHLSEIKNILKDSRVMLGAQNCSSEASGAFTGEVSCEMIKSSGAQYVIIGHSERRTYFGENDITLNRKTKLALENELNVIFCCGELLPEREKGIHFDVVKKQLYDGLFNLNNEEISNIVIAYEPVWAIGTGLTASPAQAQEMHKYIRDLLKSNYGAAISDNMPILYGGSCKPSNAAELFAMGDVDGGLIGGASLKSEDFCAIAEAF